MRHTILTRRCLGLTLALAMMTPAFAPAADAAIGTWLSPPAGERIMTRSVDVSVGYNTHSNLVITRLELWVDGKFYAKKDLVSPETRGVCSFAWDTSDAGRGQHDLLVKLYSYNDLVSRVSGTGTVGQGAYYDTRPPVVSFANVKSGDVLHGTTVIKLKASADSGQAPLVSLLVDHALKLIKNRPPYDYDLDTTTYADGSHEMMTYAYDGSGNMSDPAVVKVVFRNDMKRPIVTALDVKPAGPAGEEGQDAAGSLPPVAVISALAQLRHGSGRVSDGQDKAKSGGVVSRPIASHPKASASSRGRLTRMASAAAAIPQIPAFVSKPGDLSVSHPAPKPALAVTSHAAMRPSVPAKPAVLKIASVSKPARQVSAPVASSPRTAPVKTAPAAVRMASAAGSVAASSAGPSLPDIQEVARLALASPVISRVSNAPVFVPGKVRVSSPMYTSLGKLSAPNIDVKEASKHVRMAMAPNITDSVSRGARIEPRTSPTFHKDTKAKLEKRTVPTSGKVKLRDLVHSLGGIVFWDGATHTVTAYTSHLKMVFTIGSDTAHINGQAMTIDTAPRIAMGRTIIDVAVYHQAVAFVAKHGLMHTASAR